jgi:hypothetical protein
MEIFMAWKAELETTGGSTGDIYSSTGEITSISTDTKYFATKEEAEAFALNNGWRNEEVVGGDSFYSTSLSISEVKP